MPRFIALLFLILLFASCKPSSENEALGFNGWLGGNTNEKINTLSNHLRGFDMAMVETGHRYNELYWAGIDANWEYADYQIDKIKLAIQNGFERRPLRAESGQHFMTVSLPDMKNAIASKDSTEFFRGYQMLTNSCNACHILEKVEFFAVKEPETRQSPIRK
jgi:hypothetical protein